MFSKVIIIASIASFVIGVAYWASPYYVIRQCASAVSIGNLKTINWCTDYPALRKSLKKELRADVARNLGALPPQRMMDAAAVAAWAPRVFDLAVNAYATPEGIAKLIKLHRKNLSSFRVEPTGFESPTRFAARSNDTVYVFSFEALRWKLTSIRFPAAATAKEELQKGH